ncbi:Hypothetical protein SMAX5B_017131 [Scophthalmus maximus]|uniref:Secreted protein n=1 Tax=Scophthalmus maximus TaxID=52904 RepID=A0A2U9CMI7_SCOMX|nr:Hypothetical protein SMAX5B_017131 [Scophthalmus maximus]
MVSTLFFFSAAELAWDWFSMAIAHSLTPHEDETTGGEEEEVVRATVQCRGPLEGETGNATAFIIITSATTEICYLKLINTVETQRSAAS